MDILASTELRSILIEHEAIHTRLAEGEWDSAPAGTFDEYLANAQLRPLINVIGIKSVGDLLHVVHELFIQVLKDNEGPLTDDEQEAYEYVNLQFGRILDWASMALMTGHLE